MPLEEWQEDIDLLRLVPSSPTKADKIDKLLPEQFWHDLAAAFVSLAEMRKATGFSTTTITKRFERYGIGWDQRPMAAKYRCKEKQMAAVEAEIAQMGVRYDPMQLDPNQDWAIMPDVHGYNVDMKWFRRFLTVSTHLGVTNLLGAGDFHDWSIISRFAQDQMSTVPSLDEEISVTDKLESLLQEQFTGEIYMLISNHELRLAKILRHKADIGWLFQRIFPQVKWVDCDHVYIGGEHDVCVVHPDRAWLNSHHLADEFSRSNECDVLMAHSHTFSCGYSRSGRRIGCTGGLFDPYAPGFAYAWKHLPRKRMTQGFYIYKDRLLLPFAEGFTDWRAYGCEVDTAEGDTEEVS